MPVQRTVSFHPLDDHRITLVGLLHLPDETGRWPVAVVCHPQPFVHDYTDPLIVEICTQLSQHGIAALRFNFRGVEPSTGDATDGRLEPLDVAGAVEFLRSRPDVDPNNIVLVGEGFSAFIALTYVRADPMITTLIVISPPHFLMSQELVHALAVPMLVITGEHDEVAPRFKMESWLASVAGLKGLVVIPGAKHLMRGYESRVAQECTSYLTRHISSRIR